MRLRNPLSLRTPRKPHIRVNAREDWPWITVVGANGETILSSETYLSLGNARRAAQRLSGLTGWDVRERRAPSA